LSPSYWPRWTRPPPAACTAASWHYRPTALPAATTPATGCRSPYDQAAQWLEDSSPTSQAPALVEHAEQAGRLAALAIGALDRDAPSVPEAIADCLAYLLVVCVLADEAGHHLTP
jgi:hypothetical protein